MTPSTGAGARPRVIRGISELRRLVGRELGVSRWREVGQDDIDAFAAVTEDRQWIHLDRERAAASPFGGTIAHGYLTLSLGPRLSQDVYAIEGFAYAVNYGLGRVRFPAPMPAGERLRMRVALTELSELQGAAQLTLTQTFEREGADKPVCVAEMLVRFYEG